MSLRPDLVDVWIHRAGPAGPEILLMRRAPGRILPGLWQGVSGSIEPGERVAEAALREVREETGYGPGTIQAFHHLDYVASFLWEPIDSVISSAYFALRVHPQAEPVLSHEHDACRWVTIDAAIREVVWPAYREALVRVRDCVLDPAREPWFRLERPAL